MNDIYDDDDDYDDDIYDDDIKLSMMMMISLYYVSTSFNDKFVK